MLLPLRFLTRCRSPLLLRRANSTATPTAHVVDVATKYKVPEGYLLAYEGGNPRWARWTLLWCGIMIIISGNAAEGSLHLRQKPNEKGEENLPSNMWEYRPWYQRYGLAAGFLGFGGAACFFALTARKRRVLRLFVRHSQIPKQPSTVIIEGCDSGKRGKKVFPIQECTLGPGRAEGEFSIHPQSLRMTWWPYVLDLKKGYVPSAEGGPAANLWQKEQAFSKLWENKTRVPIIRRVRDNSVVV